MILACFWEKRLVFVDNLFITCWQAELRTQYRVRIMRAPYGAQAGVVDLRLVSFLTRARR